MWNFRLTSFYQPHMIICWKFEFPSSYYMFNFLTYIWQSVKLYYYLFDLLTDIWQSIKVGIFVKNIANCHLSLPGQFMTF